jgi:hypothetical protein
VSPAANRLRVARAGALLALGSLVVHQLRYLIAFGSESGAELHEQGHAYLAQSLPILLTLAGAAIAARLLVGAASHGRAHGGRSTWARAVLYGIAIAGVFSVQELAEGALSPGHPAGIGALVGFGGWMAAPLALLLGLAAAGIETLLDRAEAVLATVLRGSGSTPLDPPIVPGARSAPRCEPPAASALAFGFARRPPPLPALS